MSSDRNAYGNATGLAVFAERFNDPFVARNGLRHRFLHELLFGVDLGTAARSPFGPDEFLRLRAGCLGIDRLVTDRFDVLAAGATRAGNTEVFLLAAPADDGDFFLFADQPAGFLYGCVAAAAVGAAALIRKAAA